MFEGKTAVVTGGAKGIGAEISRLFSRKRYAVAICYKKSKTQADELAAELNEAGGNAVALYADLSSVNGAESTVADSAPTPSRSSAFQISQNDKEQCPIS